MAETGEKTNMVPPGTVTGFGVWLPIETAPKDGKQVLIVLSKSRAVGVGAFLRDRWVLIRAGDWEMTVKEGGVTHWRPLPEPPE